MKESELRDNDWIRLYLELTLVAHDRSLTVVRVFFSLSFICLHIKMIVALTISSNCGFVSAALSVPVGDCASGD